jgi:hypothetical protein
MLHVCTNHPNRFCYVCGQLTFKSQLQNFIITNSLGISKTEIVSHQLKNYQLSYVMSKSLNLQPMPQSK